MIEKESKPSSRPVRFSASAAICFESMPLILPAVPRGDVLANMGLASKERERRVPLYQCANLPTSNSATVDKRIERKQRLLPELGGGRFFRKGYLSK